MLRSQALTELRRHPRAQLRLPARIRWQGPLGMRLEVTETIDVSREGLLLRCAEPCETMIRVWVTFPFDAKVVGAAQPEMPARIVRTEEDFAGGFRAALQFYPPARSVMRPASRERRKFPRACFALPIFVRPTGMPWPEESMTDDISRGGVRFETAHIYAVGDRALVKVPWNEWADAGEISGRVVRVESLADRPGPASFANPAVGAGTMFTSVALEWAKPEMIPGAAQRLPRA